MELMGGYIPCQAEKAVCVGTDWNRQLRPRQSGPCYCYGSVAKSCPTLFDHKDCSLPGSSAHGISQARILEWVALSFSRGSSWPREPSPPALAGFFITEPPGKPKGHQLSSVAQLCPTLCDPMDCSIPGFPVHHQLLEPTQTHVYCVSDAIQLFHPLSSSSPPAFNLFQHQGLFQWVGSQSIGASASALLTH